MTSSVQLDSYLQAWSLTDAHLLTTTATSSIYTVQHQGETVVLKLLNEVGAADEGGGAVALDYWQGQGAVRLLQQDAHAHLLEYAEGADLAKRVRQGNDSEATRMIAGVLNQLHSASSPLPTAGLKPLSLWFRSLFRRAQQEHTEELAALFQQGAAVAEKLLADPREVRVLHGDIHHENIRHKAGRGWLAFDPKGLIGERTYDAANTLCNPPGMPELVLNENRLRSQAALLAREARLDEGRLLAYTFAYACLSASWSMEDGGDATAALTIASMLRHDVQAR
ncbi:MAG: phosphotransferase [Anaerolineae bacterium]|nr:phosphotransferase [Anaerolineae bacterium]